MPNAWIEHVKKFAKEKGLSYMCAATDEECKRTYRESKPPKPPKAPKAKKAAKQAEPILDKKARAKARISPLTASLREALDFKMDKKTHKAHLEIEKAIKRFEDSRVFEFDEPKSETIMLSPDEVVFGSVIEKLNIVIDAAPKAKQQKIAKALGAWAKEFIASRKKAKAEAERGAAALAASVAKPAKLKPNKYMTREEKQEFSRLEHLAEQAKAAAEPQKDGERGYVILDDDSKVSVKPLEIDGDDDDYYQDAKGNIYDYKDDRVGIIEDGAPVLFSSVLDETLIDIAETDAILDRMLFIISKSPKKYPEVVDYITTIQEENLKPELYEKYANLTPMQKKIYQLTKESFPVIRIMDDEGTGEMSHYAIRFSWHKSSKKNITVDDYTSSGDGKDIAELRLSSTLKPGTAKVRSSLVKLLAKLKPAKKPRAKAKPKAKAKASKPAAKPAAKPKKSAAAQGVLGNKDLLGMIKSYTNEFSPAEMAALKKRYGNHVGFSRDRFGNIIIFSEHIGDIRLVEIKNTEKSKYYAYKSHDHSANEAYNLRKDSEDIEEPKPRHKEFKEYAKLRRVQAEWFERIAEKHGIDAFGEPEVQKEYRDGLIKIAKFYVMGKPPPAKRLSPDKQRRLDRAKQQLAQMDRAQAMGMMMDEDQREAIEDTVYELELETIL